jgi:galactose mutarotase-like enzyme
VGVSDVDSESEASSKSKIIYAMRAKLEDEKTKGTPVNLTIHWGFNLGGKKGEKDDIKEHKLWLDVSNFVF